MLLDPEAIGHLFGIDSWRVEVKSFSPTEARVTISLPPGMGLDYAFAHAGAVVHGACHTAPFQSGPAPDSAP